MAEPAADARPPRRGGAVEWLVVALCLAAGVGLFLSLDTLWPLARMDLVVPADRIQGEAEAFLRSRGFDPTDYRAASAITVDTGALDYVESAFGRRQAQSWIEAGLPLFRYRSYFKKAGESTSYRVVWHPAAGVVGWSRWVEDDEPGERLPVEQARGLALAAIESGLGLTAADYDERSASSTEYPARTDHSFRYERQVAEAPELRERISINVAGDQVVLATRTLIVPAAATRAARAAEAPGRALETAGIVLLAIGVLGAFFVFLTRLQTGAVRLRRALVLPVVVFICLIGTYALERANLFDQWEPLWPKWISDFQYLSFRSLEGLLLGLLLLILVAAGDALDREGGADRGASLWSLTRGRIDRGVALASSRGFLVGLLCGGVMVAVVLSIDALFGGRTSIQPRGFFFYTLNTASPLLTSLLFFLGIALAEELGYRFFGGTWILALTRRRWLAIAGPAVIYGLVHTRLDFLPMAEPWWARACVLTTVGLVWGIAFFRYDALTVVLSHFTADLFIFNWPRLGSGQTSVALPAALAIAVPLLPAAWWLIRRRE